MAFTRLLLLVGLITSAAASTLTAPAPPGCDLSILAPKLARHCQYDPDVPSFLLSPTKQCCEALLSSVPEQEETALPCLCRAAAESPASSRSTAAAAMAASAETQASPTVERMRDVGTAVCTAATLAKRVSQFCGIDERFPECCKAVVNTVVLTGRPPCLCRVAAEPPLAAAGLNATGILELYSDCGGRTAVGPHLADACNDWYPRAPALPMEALASASCAPKNLAVLMVWYVHKDPTALTCRDLVDSVDLGGGVPCLCRAAVETYTISRRLKATDLLAIYKDCGGLRLGGADHKAAAESCQGYGLPLPPSDTPPTTSSQDHDGGAIRLGTDTLPETTAA